ncbi:hypothetical protein [Polyangium mundeleinium]|uniref:Lipoprotein n=1 Tax=Polyangium mundeleinium TaxID=2995306 RepID=A0ABT5F7E8_9BACT|nr:hypothetical protein [Polyangium mundeleinium]MDC0750019.1 hypothetical protein [Polyangium mundeleinium]
MSKYAFIVASGLLASGCGLVNLQTNIPGLSGESSGPAQMGPFGILPYDEDEVGKAVLATFKSWDHTSCEPHKCVGDFKKQAGVKEYQDKQTYVYQFNPRRTLKNPDPTWLTGWDKLSEDEHSNTADITYEALIVAAMRKTWLAKCHADYAAIDKQARALDAKWSVEIADASKIPGPYGRIGALLGLQKSAEEAAPKTDTYTDNLLTYVGFRRDLRVAIKQAYEATGRDYLYAIHGPGASDNGIRARLDAATERDMYCFHSSGGANAFSNSYTEHGAKYVKPLFSEETLKKIDRLREKESKKSADEARPAAIDKVYIQDIAEGKTEMPGHPKLGYVSETDEVKKITQNGGKTELEMVYSYTNEYPYDCVETNRIHSIRDGRIVYREICKTGKHTHERTMRITLGEMPEGVTIQVGDKLTGYAFVKKHEKKKPTDTKAVIKETEFWELELHHLRSLQRKGKLVGQWF